MSKHTETILVAKLRKPPGVQYRREILLTSDRAAVTIDWEHHDDEGKVRVALGVAGLSWQFGSCADCTSECPNLPPCVRLCTARAHGRTCRPTRPC
jgi:predicted alpha/beta-fold hydrolase